MTPKATHLLRTPGLDITLESDTGVRAAETGESIAYKEASGNARDRIACGAQNVMVLYYAKWSSLVNPYLLSVRV
jgi:hypothetical protein